MIQMTFPMLEQKDFHRTPHRHPSENQQTLLEALNESAFLKVAQQAAQPEAAGEHADSDSERETSTPQTASKISLALRMPTPKVFVYRIARITGAGTKPLGKVNQQPHLVRWPILSGACKDVAFDPPIQRPLPQRCGIQRVVQLLHIANADLDSCRDAALGMIVAHHKVCSAMGFSRDGGFDDPVRFLLDALQMSPVSEALRV